MNILVTGGSGFIGSALIRYVIDSTDHIVINLDKLSSVCDPYALISVQENPRYHFEKMDICDAAKVKRAFLKYQPDLVVHLAAESHVDRSIQGPADFIQSNIIGTYTLLEVAREYWHSLNADRKETFRFHHVSTDEVFGDLENTGRLFNEETRYAPSSPYSASKASADHLVRAWHRTYGLPVVITNCSNNYGPYQFSEKLIPRIIVSALAGKPLPVYGSGDQIRDWLYVEDHVRALYLVATQARTGSTYNIGGHNEKKNIDVVKNICALLEDIAPNKPQGVAAYADLITYIQDRPGHDIRYAIDASKIAKDLGWKPSETFDSGLFKTVSWYVDQYARRNDHSLLRSIG